MQTDRLERCLLLLRLAILGERRVFDQSAMFGEIDKDTATAIWRAGRLAALNTR